MATTWVENLIDTAGTLSGLKQSPKAMEHNLLSGLPQGHEKMAFSGFDKLQKAAKFVFDKLNANGQSGNQFIVVLDLPKSARDKLNNDKDVLGGIGFRFQFDDTIGVIKVPSAAHDFTTENLKDEIRDAALAMGVLVIETGVTESLPKLEEDVQWWFQNSNGDVRIVLVLSINKSQRTALLQKWQLAPVNTPQPMTRAVLNRLRRQVPPPMPPLLQQMPRSQQPYIHQEIQMTQTTMTGGPLVLPFEALFCRPPQGTETDITLNQQELLPILRNL